MDLKGLVEEEMKRFEGLQLIDRLSAPDSGTAYGLFRLSYWLQ